MEVLIFTDLDGTLMEHNSYSIEPARGILAQLVARGTPPIINSSKTRAEISEIQSQLGLHCPFICENGAAIHDSEEGSANIPHTQVFGPAVNSWLAAVHTIREQHNYKFTGFSDWSVEELADLTGLDNKSASLAKQREFSEPIQWHDSESALNQFREELDNLGLQLIEGGRFFSIQGNYDKSTAMQWLAQRNANPEKLIVALGDSPNDIAMLEAADIAVIVKSAKSNLITLNKPSTVIHTTEPGPEGWQAAMHEVIDMLDSDKAVPHQENNHG